MGGVRSSVISEVEKVLLLGPAKKDSKTLRVVFSLKPEASL